MSQAIPTHKFHGRAWFFWYLMIIFVGIGAAAIVFGMAMLSGVISSVDVHGVVHPEGSYSFDAQARQRLSSWARTL